MRLEGVMSLYRREPRRSFLRDVDFSDQTECSVSGRRRRAPPQMMDFIHESAQIPGVSFLLSWPALWYYWPVHAPSAAVTSASTFVVDARPPAQMRRERKARAKLTATLRWRWHRCYFRMRRWSVYPAAVSRRKDDEDTHDPRLKFPLLDLGFKPGKEFCENLLDAGDFNKSTIEAFGHRGFRSGHKRRTAEHVAGLLIDGKVDPDAVMLDFCRQPRMWLTFKTGPTEYTLKDLRRGQQFLTEFGPWKGAWYGPFKDDEDEEGVEWFAYSAGFTHWLDQGPDEQPKRFNVRWHAVAEVAPTYTAIHWNNFSHNERDQDSTRSNYFDYWITVPAIFDELQAQLQAKWKTPSLHVIIMNHMRKRYAHAEDASWNHRKVRAEKDGVALNASSSQSTDDKEFSVQGLEALTAELARAALRALGLKTDNPKFGAVDNEMLETLIQRWGTKSYAFSIDGTMKQKIMSAHAVFGTKPQIRGPDCFPHIRCYHEGYGGSIQAMQVIKPFLERK